METNIEFLGEFPSTVGVPCSHQKPNNIFEGRFCHQPRHREVEKFPKLEVLRTYINKCANALESAHNIAKPVASEILMFILSDLDRMFHPEQPHAFPVCYGMKGYSLKTETLRNMIFHVLDEWHRRDMHVPVISFDGQWYRLLVRDSNGRPLTKLQLQKDVFGEAKKIPKQK